jgi:hypothetical protein
MVRAAKKPSAPVLPPPEDEGVPSDCSSGVRGSGSPPPPPRFVVEVSRAPWDGFEGPLADEPTMSSRCAEAFVCKRAPRSPTLIGGLNGDSQKMRWNSSEIRLGREQSPDHGKDAGVPAPTDATAGGGAGATCTGVVVTADSTTFWTTV